MTDETAQTAREIPTRALHTASSTSPEATRRPTVLPELSTAPEARLLQTGGQRKLYIGGEFLDPQSGKWRDTINPATGEVLAEVAEAGDVDVDTAVAAARKALPVWRGLSGLDRAKYLYRISRIVAERARELAVTETLDGGKPIRESRDVDVPAAMAHLFSYAGWADKLEFANKGQNPEPLGVVAQVIPWNFPLLMAAWKIGPALACGNTVVLKPAETTPLTALLLAEICEQAELPPGVVNIITGGGATGAALVGHNDINKVAFTGSSAVGRAIAQATAGRNIPATLELGGKGANIVFSDAAVDDAVEGIIAAIFFNQGHVCCAGSRLLVAEDIAEEVCAKLLARIERIRVGDPMDKNTDIGAINSKAQYERICGFLERATATGAIVHQPSTTLPDTGLYIPPTVVFDVESSAEIVREEVFGPVLTVQTFRTPQEAIALANDSLYGLAAGVWTSDASVANKAASALRAGVVWVNTYNVFNPTTPFGGMRVSGWGREGGKMGLEGYLR